MPSQADPATADPAEPWEHVERELRRIAQLGAPSPSWTQELLDENQEIVETLFDAASGLAFSNAFSNPIELSIISRPSGDVGD